MPAHPHTIWTIGHSTRPGPAFIALLTHHGIDTLADVRTHPGSRRYPQFNQDTLRAALAEAGIAYTHMPELGGRRKPRPDSINTAWRNDSFRGYADYMQSPVFEAGLARLQALAAGHRVAIMCAEAVWWQCHRGLIADALKVRGFDVLHIESEAAPKPHPYTPAARIVEGRLLYTAPANSGGLFEPDAGQSIA